MQIKTKKGVLISLSSIMVLGMLLTQFQETSLFNADASTLTATLSTGTWVNKFGVSNAFSDIANSPYTITSQGMDYVLSVGFYDAGQTRAVYGAYTALSASNHFKLNKDSSLALFDALTNFTFEGVLVMKSDLWNVSVSSLTMTWEQGSNDHHTFYFIYSLDGGLSWQLDSDATQTSINGSAKTVTLNSSIILGNRVRVGILNGLNTNANDLSFYNPELTVTYESLSDQDSSDLLTNEVMLYTPCETDEDQLILISEDKKYDFIQKYANLSNNAKILFQNQDIGDNFTAYDRYTLVIKPRN